MVPPMNAAPRRTLPLTLALVTAALAFVPFWIAYEHFVRHGGAHPYPWRDATAQVGRLEPGRQTGLLFDSTAALRHYLSRAEPGQPVARIRLHGSRALLIASGARSSTGYSVEVARVIAERGRIVVRVRERTPGLAERVAPRVTFPFRLITLPAGDKPVFLDWEGRP